MGKLKEQMAHLMAWIADNYSRFYDSKKKKFLLTGKGGLLNIVETSYGSIFWNGECKELLVLFEYCITYRDKSVDAERIGSYMNLTKSRLRQALGDESFCALVFLSFNSPALNQVYI